MTTLSRSHRLAVALAFLPVGLAALILLGCRRSPPGQSLPPNQPQPSALEQQDEDYAAARSRFKTRLVRSGPSPQPYQELKRPPEATEVEYASGSLRLKAWVNRPAAEDGTKRPAVLFLHGGFAFDEGDWAMPKPYRDAGYVTLAPRLRGENGLPGDFTLFYDELNDVLSAADFLAKQPYVDPKRLYVAGHSVGGTMTLLAALAGDRFRAAASFSGSPNQTEWIQGEDDKKVVFDRSDRREFIMRSPEAFATRFRCPLRIYYGSEEAWADRSSRRTAEAARQKGLDVEAVCVPGDHHSHVPASIRQSIEFFKEHEGQPPGKSGGQ